MSFVRRDVERRCLDTARYQFGLITRHQAFLAGATERFIKWRLAEGRWELVHPGVYRIAGHPDSWHQSELAACFWAQGIASHRAAGVLWEFPGCVANRPEVTVPGIHLPPRSGIIVHSTLRLPDHHVAQRARMPCTSIERTLLDLGAVLQPLRVAFAVDDALHRGLTSVGSLYTCVADVCGRGVRGCGVLRKIIGERVDISAAPESPLETIAFKMFRESHLPMPVPQFRVTDQTGRFIARVDFAYPESRLAIECHSRKWHQGKAAWDSDAKRLSELSTIGWRVIFVTFADMTRYRQQTVDKIEAARVLSESGAV